MPPMHYLQELETMRQLVNPAISPGLERIEALLAELNNPQLRLKTIHIAGTNGKGSICAMLDAMLIKGGYRTGRFTSPHMHDFRQRCLINGQVLNDQSTTALLKTVNAALRRLKAKNAPNPTEFEASTAMAFLAMAEADIDFAIIEVGLGGRFDATNMLNPGPVIITNIGWDHMDYLGDSLAKIAWEKAGIIKDKAMVFTAATGEPLKVIADIAQAKDADLQILGQDIFGQVKAYNQDSQSIDINTKQKLYTDLQLPLLGEHQVENAALAVAMAEYLGLNERDIRLGLMASSHPGRLEILCRKPLIIVDGAHNQEGMAALNLALEQYWPQQKKLFLLGILADKPRKQALDSLFGQIDGAIITCPPIMHRSDNWAEVATILQQKGLAIDADSIIENYQSACEFALQKVAEYDMLIVSGSLYLVAEIRGYLKQKWGEELY